MLLLLLRGCTGEPWGAAQAAKQAKDEGRAGLTAAIRPLVRRLQASSAVSNAEREALGITVANEPSPIGPPTTAPLCSIECGARLQHTLRFVDETTPTRKAKPAGVLGVEIWNKVGETPPASESELRFVAVDMTCLPNPDPVPMRVPAAAGCGQETLEDEADQTFGGTDRDQAA